MTDGKYIVSTHSLDLTNDCIRMGERIEESEMHTLICDFTFKMALTISLLRRKKINFLADGMAATREIKS